LLGLLPDVALATGSACSSGAIGESRVLRAMGLSDQRVAGAVRIGFGRPSRAEEIDEAADRIAAALQRLEEDS
jgi:cysteine desulfurase